MTPPCLVDRRCRGALRDRYPGGEADPRGEAEPGWRGQAQGVSLSPGGGRARVGRLSLGGESEPGWEDERGWEAEPWWGDWARVGNVLLPTGSSARAPAWSTAPRRAPPDLLLCAAGSPPLLGVSDFCHLCLSRAPLSPVSPSPKLRSLFRIQTRMTFPGVQLEGGKMQTLHQL